MGTENPAAADNATRNPATFVPQGGNAISIDKKLLIKFSAIVASVILAVVVLSVFFCMPNFLPASITKAGPSWWRPMQLGLDLRGGSYLLLEVDTSVVLKQQLADLEETAKTALRDANVKYSDLRTIDGGVLVRFAGPRLAAGDDDLVPVRLRRGGRILGGSLSWEQPQQLAAFPRESPFFGIAAPPDVTVSRQVLAEPDATLTDRTWATLAVRTGRCVRWNSRQAASQSCPQALSMSD